MSKLDLSLLGKTKGPVETEYTWKDAALYALAVGAGADELAFLYEGHPGGMRVLPGFVVVPAIQAWPDLDNLEKPLLMHGEQVIRLHQAIPPNARLVQTGQVKHIWDKGSGALIQVEISGTLMDGSPLFETQCDIFYVGGGGFGGERGPKSPTYTPPQAPPDLEITYHVPRNQAALYRLLGDLNPLHIDQEAAAFAGLPRPILHGLCTYGYASRAIVTGLLDGQPERLKEFSARFASPVFPGDNLTIKAWRDRGQCFVEAETPNGKALKNGLAKLA